VGVGVAVQSCVVDRAGQRRAEGILVGVEEDVGAVVFVVTADWSMRALRCAEVENALPGTPVRYQLQDVGARTGLEVESGHGEVYGLWVSIDVAEKTRFYGRRGRGVPACGGDSTW
jgi:hypothetical protein